MHYRFEDGDFIHTSRIEKIYLVNKGMYVFETHSGSLYQAYETDLFKDLSENSNKLMKEIKPFFCDTIIDRLKTLEADFIEKRKLQEDVLSSAASWSDRNMAVNELYLIIEELQVRKAIFKYENKSYEIISTVHAGIFQDSVLVTDWTYGRVDFRYFPNEQIEPYHWSDGLKNM